MSDDTIDQDAMAAEWEAMANEEGGDSDDDKEDSGGQLELDADTGEVDQDAMAAEWEAMASGDDSDDTDAWSDETEIEEIGQTFETPGDRVLNQDEIDSLLGFRLEDNVDRSGIRALINSALVTYERLPMLENVVDRMVRLMTTSLRNFTSDNVEVSLDHISSIRFGDYLNSIPLPAIITVIRAQGLDNYLLATVDSSLIYSIVDVLLGGRRGTSALRVEGRPYTTIERTLIRRLIEVVLEDLEKAFEPLADIKFKMDRIETNPRFAAIARPSNAAILVKLRIDMEDRGGRIEMLLPYGTLEPIRKLLLQSFMGEKFGRDNIWESHLATELWSTKVRVDAVLSEQKMNLSDVMKFEVGQTLMLGVAPDSPLSLKCGNANLVQGRMGRSGANIAVQVDGALQQRTHKMAET